MRRKSIFFSDSKTRSMVGIKQKTYIAKFGEQEIIVNQEGYDIANKLLTETRLRSKTIFNKLQYYTRKGIKSRVDTMISNIMDVIYTRLDLNQEDVKELQKAFKSLTPAQINKFMNKNKALMQEAFWGVSEEMENDPFYRDANREDVDKGVATIIEEINKFKNKKRR